MYWPASCGAIRSANTISKNSTPSAAMLNGLTSQFTTRVMMSPFGRRWTVRRLATSMATIMG